MADDHSPAAVFGLLSDGTRVGILRAVAAAQHERERSDGGPAELSFSEIYDRVDVDSTSKLSYHLGELTGTFLRKRDGGYSFTHAGEAMVRFILARNYERPPAIERREIDGACLFCGESPLEATLHDQFFSVACPACDRPVATYPVSPAQARSWDGAALVRKVAATHAADYGRIRRGICPACSGRVSASVREVDETPHPDADPYIVVDDCEQCQRRYGAPLTYRTAYHPASVAFHWDRGVDLRSQGLWDFTEHLVEGRWTAGPASTDDAAYEVVLRRGDDELRLFLDADPAVVRTEVVRRSAAPGSDE